MAVFHTFHLSCKDIMGLMLAALRRLLFNLLPLLEVFRPLIYLFILIIVFFCPCLLANFSLRWIESGESWLVVLSGVVIHLARAIHQYPHSVLTGLHLSLRSHKNQLISPAKRSIFFLFFFMTVSYDFIVLVGWKRRNSATIILLYRWKWQFEWYICPNSLELPWLVTLGTTKKGFCIVQIQLSGHWFTSSSKHISYC